MPLDQGIQYNINVPAGTTLTTFRIAALIEDGTTGVGKAYYSAGTTTPLLGAITNKPRKDEGCGVQIGGVARLTAGAAINTGAKVGSNTQGFAIAVTGANEAFVGVAKGDASGSGIIFECIIDPGFV